MMITRKIPDGEREKEEEKKHIKFLEIQILKIEKLGVLCKITKYFYYNGK